MPAPHKCPTCGHNRGYSYRHDAFYCEGCNVWMNGKCPDPKCIFCSERPEKPVFVPTKGHHD